MQNIYPKSQCAKKPSGMVLKSQQLEISLKFIAESFEYGLSSADRPQYFTSTEVDRNTPWRQVCSGTHMVHQQRHMASGKK